MLRDAAQRSPDAEALVCGDTRLTYRVYWASVVSCANRLRADGVRGERVALLMGNSPDLCIAMFAAQLAGAQVVPLNPSYTASELGPLLADAAPVLLIHDAANAARDAALAAALGIPRRLAVGPGTGLIDAGAVAEPFDGALPAPGDLAVLQFTGGTTGRAKGAEITHHSLAVNIAQRDAVLPTRPGIERILCVMPLFHCYAIHMCLHNMVNCRGTLVIVPRYHPVDVLALFARERITLFGGSPTLFAGLLNTPEFATTDFSTLHVTYSGASALSADLLARWEACTGAPVVEGYGQSEAGPVASFNPLHGVRKPASVGIALPGVDIEIVDLERGERVLPIGECGEIRLRGPQIMRGYRHRPEETAATLRNGWLYTGDTGEFDADGYLYIRGRKKEMIIVSGFNVYPREIEEVLMQAPGVGDCAVIGIADAYRGELPLAFVVPAAGATPVPADLAAFCGTHLAPYKHPREFRIVANLPKTSVGKLDRVSLKQMAGAAS